MKETPNANYIQRTEWNVRDSDAAVIFTVADPLTGGSRHTADFALAHGRPCLHLASERGDADPAHLLRQFVADHDVQILNVAGSRASEEPAVGEFVQATLDGAFGRDGLKTAWAVGCRQTRTAARDYATPCDSPPRLTSN